MENSGAENSSAQAQIKIEVAFALAEQQEIIELMVSNGVTAEDAVRLSGIREKYPDVEFAELTFGIFSRPLNGIVLPLPEDYILQENDRVEIYRPLLMDPKQARLERAQKRQLQKTRK